MEILEKAILGIVIDNPSLAPILFGNTDENIWEEADTHNLWLILKDLYVRGESWSWIILESLCEKEIKRNYLDADIFNELVTTTIKLPPILQEQTLVDFLQRLKTEKAKREIRKKIYQEYQQKTPDLDEIERIINEGKLKYQTKENTSADSVYDKYLSWLKTKRLNINTGFPSFDRETDSFNYGELITFMGRTRTGKTWLALNVVLNIIRAHADLKIGFFSLEMPQIAIAERLFQIEYEKSRWNLKLVVPSDEGGWRRNFSDRFKNLFIFENPYSATEIESLTKKNEFKIIFIDFLGLVKSKDNFNSLYQKTTQKITEIKQLAKNCNCIVFLLTQLSRAAGDGSQPVNIDSARDSGAIEEMSDFIYGIWNPSLATGFNEENKERLCLSLLKNKRGQSGLPCIFHFNKETGKIYEEEKSDKG